MVVNARSVLIDARWLGRGGSGRVTEMVLKGLHEVAPLGQWTIWGSPEARPFLWPHASLWEDTVDPQEWFGQRRYFHRRPTSFDIAVFFHQIRPLRRMATTELTTIHDTIPFRYPSMPRVAWLMRFYMRTIAQRTDNVLTGSRYSKECIERDLAVPAEKIVFLPLSVDPESSDRIRQLRATRDPADFVLYVGADQPHKNLDRLVSAFRSTQYFANGGHLVMVGIGEGGARRLSELASSSSVECRPRVSQEELETLLATTRLLIQPSLEEGFGLPIAEAMAAGVPVAASRGGSLPEITREAVPLFDPTDEQEIARTIDHTLRHGVATSADIHWPTPVDYAGSLINLLRTL
jgi:glycosyltransferase involved in cell wall biosynthesis